MLKRSKKDAFSSQLGNTIVTGGAGFVGSHVVDRLIKDGIKVKVLDNLSAGSFLNLSTHKSNKNFNFIKKFISPHIKIVSDFGKIGYTKYTGKALNLSIPSAPDKGHFWKDLDRPLAKL